MAGSCAFTPMKCGGKLSKSKMVPGGNSNTKLKSYSGSKASIGGKVVSQPIAVNNFGSYTKQHGHKGKP